MSSARSQSDRLQLLGVRHHGPGSARAVMAALEAADPAVVLIEGPPDANELIPFAISPAMVPPVALLVHAEDDPANASFYPFAVYSPEWQAMRWALAKSRPVRFIDLPSANRLAERAKAVQQEARASDEPTTEAAAGPEQEPGDAETEARRIRRDPLAYLAEIAGYDDSEAWWNAVVEQGTHGSDVFAAIEQAMAALRERFDAGEHWPPEEVLTEQRREAHMRLAIAEALSDTEGTVAVVCGAWHVPALRGSVAAKDDRALLKGLPKIKVAATWVPWTETRLAAGSGYGAGVLSPGWYAHLWQELEPGEKGHASPRKKSDVRVFASRWQARVAALLRNTGRPASTASVIEAARLAMSLAALRDLALPGLDEMREASLSTLCEGEAAPFKLIERELVIGQRVGEIDGAVPQMPLAADLARWQKKLKLKPEALDTEISLDLRSESGLAKSLLLNRLLLIDVPWGTQQGTGSSRGTFRENWRLRWEPELSVKLVEALVWGTTIEQAAANGAVAKAGRTSSLAEIATLVRGCLEAGLDEAATATIALLQRAAAATSDTIALAGAVPPLANILRYGTAREMPVAPLRLLVVSLVETVCAGLTYACRNLQAEAAQAMRESLAALGAAMGLIEEAALTETWRRALGEVAEDDAAHPLLRGFAVRVLYDQGVLGEQAAALGLSRALSPSVPPAEAGDWIDGFIGRSGQLLLHDDVLRSIIDRWLVALGEGEFTNLLPVLRRGFASFDRSERRRLLDEIAKIRGTAPALPASTVRDDGEPHTAAPGFAAALPLLLNILGMPEEGATP